MEEPRPIRIPQPHDEVEFVWRREQVQKMELALDEVTGEARGIGRDLFIAAWCDPGRTDFEVRDLGFIVYVVSSASLSGRAEIRLVWRFYKRNPRRILPRTAYFPPV